MVIDTLDRLRAALKRPGFTKRELAKLAGIHHNTLLGCEEDSWNPTLDTLRKLEPHIPPFEAGNGLAPSDTAIVASPSRGIAGDFSRGVPA